MKRLKIILLLMIALLSGAVISAQDEEPDPYELIVDPESAVIRQLPSFEAEFVASTFRSDVLEAVGRNLDGTWFEVRRPGRMSNLGWISRTVVDFDFMPETLPLTDFTTGSTGDFVQTRDTGFAAFTLAEVNLRVQPIDGQAIITRAPFGVVLPVLERDQIGTWFLVNYLGTTGWVNAANLRGVEDYSAIPIAGGLPEIPVASTFTIPLDIQLSEIQAFREYISAQNQFAEQVAGFWTLVMDYEVMPCEPPPFVTNYLYSQDQERAFPELEYLVPRLSTATEFINASIEPMYICGVKRPQVVLDAKNAALNASIIYEATLASLDIIEIEITKNR